MKQAFALITLLLTSSALGGCLGGDKDDDKTGNGNGDGVDTASLATFEYALGNLGYRVSGSHDAAGVAVGDGSAAEISFDDQSTSDATSDRATFILNVKTDDLEVAASLKQMALPENFQTTGDFGGGVERDAALPGQPFGGAATNAYVILYGMADLRLDGKAVPGRQPMIVAVTQGLRAEDGTVAATPDADDLEMHVVFPSVDALPADGFLYFYFESVVEVRELTEDEKAKLPARDPPKMNKPPTASAAVKVGGAAVKSAVREGETNLTVTLDGSNSTDPDGSIVVYVWKIFELNASKVWIEVDDNPSGAQAEWKFSTAGVKRIELIVRDDSAGIDNETIDFYVDQHRLLPGKSSQHSNTVSGYNSCYSAVNCFIHRITVESGAVSGRLELKDNGSAQLNERHVDLYSPGAALPNQPTSGGDPPKAASATNAALEVDHTVLNQSGSYDVAAWWRAGVAVKYDLDVLITYTPVAAVPQE